MNQSTPGVVPLRSRGRPPKTAADQETLKTRIVDATLQAFAEHGYRNMTVEHILLNAGISRPTFYKYFPQLEEPLALAAARINHDLLACIKQALQSANDPIMAATAACHAYIDWGIKLGKVLQPLYAEFYETSSPISRYRLQSIAGIQDMVYEALACSGRPRRTASPCSASATTSSSSRTARTSRTPNSASLPQSACACASRRPRPSCAMPAKSVKTCPCWKKMCWR